MKREGMSFYVEGGPPLLYEKIVHVLRTGKYSARTEEVYVYWIKRYIRFHDGRHPRSLTELDVNSFLTHLAVDANLSANTQAQALHAVLFLYKKVLERPLDRIQDVVRAKRPIRVPQVLAREWVAVVFSAMRGVPHLVAMLLYGTGMRLNEGLSVRIKDIDFKRGEVIVRDGKGAKDRVTMLPKQLHQPLERQLLIVRRLRVEDLARGLGHAPLPDALARKYPNAATDWAWQWVFPARTHYVDRRTGMRHRFHLHETVIQKALREAALAVNAPIHVKPHTLRHSFATHLPRTATISGRCRSFSATMT